LSTTNSLHCNLTTNQIDYTCAFLHADIDGNDSESGMNVSMPMGLDNKEKLWNWRNSCMVLKINWNLFQNLKSWWVSSLEDIWLCLFISYNRLLKKL